MLRFDYMREHEYLKNITRNYITLTYVSLNVRNISTTITVFKPIYGGSNSMQSK